MTKPLSLVVVLSTPISIYLLEGEPACTITFDEITFIDCGLGDWVGFFDLLRTEQGRIIGVRSWLPDPENAPIRNKLARHSSVEERPGGAVHLYFGTQRTFDETLSDDQSLGMHQILSSESGMFALTYDIADLSNSEIADVASIATTPSIPHQGCNDPVPG